ncbi:FGGY-family carbohydrate kinase [Dinoroseobacter sp. S124A]|uniref:FGGY-family carbohydrate kinase n=1 Tax=Dinoroseobacter sp. S124A TaxID=3415128 RepID=UPI003C7A2460
MSDLRLGIDIGTSGIRSAVLAPDGAVLSSARAAHLPQPDPDHIDAEAWWQATCTCLATQATALAEIGRDLREVGRIGVDGTSGTMVLTDADLRPVTRALMYNSTGFEAEATRIAAACPGPHIAKGSNSALARALCLQGEDPDQRAVHLLHQADFIAARLLGRGGISDENNTLKLGFDPETGAWPEWFAETGLRLDLLPQVLPAGARIDQIAPDMAATLGLSPNTVIHAGTTDSIAAFLAAAPLAPGAAVTSLGTTLALKILSPARVDAPELGLYSHKVGDVWLVGGASNTGGGVLASLFSPEELTALSARIDPTRPSDLDYYPLLKPGERFPVNDPALAPRMTPRPEDDAVFLHGLLDSIARIEAQGYAAIAAHGGPQPTQLYTAGGGAQNPVWTQIRARCLGLEIRDAGDCEASVGIARLIGT